VVLADVEEARGDLQKFGNDVSSMLPCRFCEHTVIDARDVRSSTDNVDAARMD
jgi:hypothetical protein